MNKIISISSIISLGCLISACSLSPNLNIPQANYNIDNQLGTLPWEKENNNTLSKQWWKEFDDENLNKVVDLVLKNNNDLKLAFIHMQQAAAQLGIDFSKLLPQFDGSVGANRTKNSINSPINRSGEVNYDNNFKMGLNLSYEIDLWSKYRDTYRASKSGFKASQYDYEAARLSIISNAVQTYFNLINAYENENTLKEAYDSAKEIYKINEDKFQVGAVGEYEFAQARANLESIALQYNETKLNKENYLKALKILSSNNLNDILYKDQAYQVFHLKEFDIPTGISSTILLQRPDISASLEKLTQQNYLIGVARTAFLPKLSITGLLGFESTDLNTLVKQGSKTWNIGGDFTMPIFHWGEIYQNVNLAKLYKDEAFVNYQNTLITAFGEIRYALIARKTIRLQYDNAQASEQSYKRIYEIAKERYDIGDMALQDYLKARQDWLNATVVFNNTKYSYANSIINIIKAFGGGFIQNENIEKNIKEQSKNLDMSFRE
ncbi:multidrug efflux transporter outer membrane subunit CmeC [Campylobacter sp. VicNov18]|uniref:multidrug efflux transporter outer membrane subunit CmeC n=1 Tax=Campylobacter bilis TaxID=2691918 RepID=UPI00130EF473|nr:multidrug efflux transporter outer membrane subunit CmeC [Campylobacter bilis]MPV63311.1 multidrug efflux transporter outer membrane subunit CmeC [Campylobacter hepaticus]MBM0636810.1 multidrug efflux transporter outer membrane subunit CmeC [Campylobacter bilis]MCC8277382.1 multidrug efflux transporter outer membrane subunit CmeC [Campylobacter bilis]MCC8299125.1 multidrug efflux transporter outer membrane subunit CmeC [Campylobacter bilis]MCC8300291.1 multidrug efflux transporter outer mem